MHIDKPKLNTIIYNMSDKKYYYSEIFYSIQGEGHYTGVPTAWIRFFLCNLQCNGFGQKDPTDPSTYELPFENFDIDSVKRVEDLPVWEKGCDSSYTWAKKFKKLMGHETPTVLADKIVDVLKTDSNTNGLFLHPNSRQHQHLCFTGGEPLMITGQAASVGIYKALEKKANLPSSMTFETNGTQKLTEPNPRDKNIPIWRRHTSLSKYIGHIHLSETGEHYKAMYARLNGSDGEWYLVDTDLKPHYTDENAIILDTHGNIIDAVIHIKAIYIGFKTDIFRFIFL